MENINYKGTIILTEGKDDKNLIINLLQKIYSNSQIKSEAKILSVDDPIYPFKVGDKDFTIATHNTYSAKKFEETIGQIYDISRFAEVEDILFIVDADDTGNRKSGLENRKNELTALINEQIGKLPPKYKPGEKCEINTKNGKKIKCGYFILPDNKRDGSIETLVLEAISREDLLNSCVKNMYTCLSENKFIKKKLTTNKQDKLRLRLYMDGLIVNQNFQYDKTYNKEIDFNHKCFDDLKNFLK